MNEGVKKEELSLQLIARNLLPSRACVQALLWFCFTCPMSAATLRLQNAAAFTYVSASEAVVLLRMLAAMLRLQDTAASLLRDGLRRSASASSSTLVV
jgi:hypothetical protein